MTNTKSLVLGIGSKELTKKFYDNWSNDYDRTLADWNYKIPLKCANLLKIKLKYEPRQVLDLACGTGLFGNELKKIYKQSNLYGSDISNASLLIAKQKKIYDNLKCLSFEKIVKYNFKFDLISLIGAMTYANNFNKLFDNVYLNLKLKGHFIFSHRIDLWKKNNFDKVLLNNEKKFKLKYKSRPILYLPSNSDFQKKIKVRIILLQKY